MLANCERQSSSALDLRSGGCDLVRDVATFRCPLCRSVPLRFHLPPGAVAGPGAGRRRAGAGRGVDAQLPPASTGRPGQRLLDLGVRGLRPGERVAVRRRGRGADLGAGDRGIRRHRRCCWRCRCCAPFRRLASINLDIATALAAAGTLAALALAVVAALVIRALCIYCALLQVVTIALFLVLLWRRRRQRARKGGPAAVARGGAGRRLRGAGSGGGRRAGRNRNPGLRVPGPGRRRPCGQRSGPGRACRPT